MTRTRCKFFVTSINHSHMGGDNIYAEAKLAPVYVSDPDGENKWFAKATPNGQITLGITNPAGLEVFELGKSYYVDFSKAD